MRRNNRSFLKGILTLVLFGTLLGVITGCRKNNTTPSDTIVVAIAAAPTQLDPRWATDAYSMRITSLLFQSLVRVGSELDVVGDAAKRWELDGLTYRFYLHPDLRFSNGRAVTEEDIQFSFEQFLAPQSPFKSAFASIDKVSTANIKGEIRVDLHLKEFSAKLLNSDLPVLKILPKEETLKAGGEFGKNPIGSGSYQLAGQSTNELRLAARLDHPTEPPKTPFVLFKVIKDDFTRFLKTYQGAIDIVFSDLPTSKIGTFERFSDRFEVFKLPGLSMTYLLINLKDPELSRLPLRKALSQAIHRSDIIAYKLDGLAAEATSILSPASPFFDPQLKNPPFDPEAAQKVIGDLGLQGREFTLKTSNGQAAVDNGKVLAYQLSQTGLRVRLQSFEWGTFYDDIKKGNFQMATLRWTGITDPDIYRIALHSSEVPPGRNRGYFTNATLDRLVTEGLSERDFQKRKELYNRAQALALEDLPFIPLWYDRQVVVVNRRVKNFKPTLGGDYNSLIPLTK